MRMTLGCDVMNGRSKLTSQQLDVFQFLLLNDPAPCSIAIRSSCPAPFKTKIPCEQIIAYWVFHFLEKYEDTVIRGSVAKWFKIIPSLLRSAHGERRGEELTLSLAFSLPITTCAPLGRDSMRGDYTGSQTAVTAVVLLICLNSVCSILVMFGRSLVPYVVEFELVRIDYSKWRPLDQ